MHSRNLLHTYFINGKLSRSPKSPKVGGPLSTVRVEYEFDHAKNNYFGNTNCWALANNLNFALAQGQLYRGLSPLLPGWLVGFLPFSEGSRQHRPA